MSVIAIEEQAQRINSLFQQMQLDEMANGEFWAEIASSEHSNEKYVIICDSQARVKVLNFESIISELERLNANNLETIPSFEDVWEMLEPHTELIV